MIPLILVVASEGHHICLGTLVGNVVLVLESVRVDARSQRHYAVRIWRGWADAQGGDREDCSTCRDVDVRYPHGGMAVHVHVVPMQVGGVVAETLDRHLRRPWGASRGGGRSMSRGRGRIDLAAVEGTDMS